MISDINLLSILSAICNYILPFPLLEIMIPTWSSVYTPGTLELESLDQWKKTTSPALYPDFTNYPLS